MVGTSSLSLLAIAIRVSTGLALLTLLHGCLVGHFAHSIHIDILANVAIRIFNVVHFLLQSWLNLQAPLQIIEGGVFQSTVAYKVVKLVTGFNNVQIKDVIQSADILLFEYTDVSIYIQISQMLFPLLETDYTDNLL